MDEYAHVSKGSLKLKRDDGSVKKKKKKRTSDAKEVVGKMNAASEKSSTDVKRSSETRAETSVGQTQAEKSFQKMQEKRQMERVLEKASKSHKKRVEEFNAHLDSLTEHYDIPKVSWTK